MTRSLRDILKIADTAFNAGSRVFKQFRGKSRQDAVSFLKNNIEMLKSPITLINLQRVLKGKSPQEIKDVLLNAHKSLSAEDALKIAEVLTSNKIDKKLPDYLEEKVNQIIQDKAKADKNVDLSKTSKPNTPPTSQPKPPKK